MKILCLGLLSSQTSDPINIRTGKTKLVTQFTYLCQGRWHVHSGMDLHKHCHASAQKQTDKICNASTHSCASQASAISVHTQHVETPYGLQPVKNYRSCS